MPLPADTKASSPRPLAYHRAIVTHLLSQEPGLWSWFASTPRRREEADAVRLDLLKSTYRLEPQAHPQLYGLANTIRELLGLTCSVTVYQAQAASVLNAALAYVPGEAHLILSGPLTSVLSENELAAVLAHELAHFLLYEENDGVYLVAADLLRALAADPVSGPAASESVRLYSLWTEIYADRWAYHLGGDLLSAIAALLKLETGLKDVSAESYLRQADEILAQAPAATNAPSHPEAYLRARALRLWAEKGAEAETEIERMIAGGLNLLRLDLVGQARAAELTRQFLQALLRPRWYQTEATLAHARQFFADFASQPEVEDEVRLKSGLERGDSSLRDYFCYLMLDFATVDRDLGEVALAASIMLAGRLGMSERFAELVSKELTIDKKALARLENEAEALLARTEAAGVS